MTRVWPALWPPWKRTTTSACSDSQSTILPLPSSPHWAPTTTTFATPTPRAKSPGGRPGRSENLAGSLPPWWRQGQAHAPGGARAFGLAASRPEVSRPASALGEPRGAGGLARALEHPELANSRTRRIQARAPRLALICETLYSRLGHAPCMYTVHGSCARAPAALGGGGAPFRRRPKSHPTRVRGPPRRSDHGHHHGSPLLP